jgi:hypothetical protein
MQKTINKQIKGLKRMKEDPIVANESKSQCLPRISIPKGPLKIHVQGMTITLIVDLKTDHTKLIENMTEIIESMTEGCLMRKILGKKKVKIEIIQERVKEPIDQIITKKAM